MMSRKWTGVQFVFASIGACLVLPVDGHAAQTECRTAALPDGTPALFCRNEQGNWTQQAGDVAIAPPVSSASSAAPLLSADASYRGTAVWLQPIQQRQRRNRNLTDLLLNTLEPRTNRQEILVSLTLRIDGTVVSGHITGGVWQSNVPISGTRRGDTCDITGRFNGTSIVYVGKCDASGFVGTMNEYRADGSSLRGSFQLNTIAFTDTSQRDSRRAELRTRCDGGSTSACVELDQQQ